MIKIIFAFALALATTSMASACKISRAGMSLSVISTVTQEAFKNIDSSSEIKAVYKENDNNNYTVETLDQNNKCSTQLFNGYFDTLECRSKAIAIITLLPIPCKSL